MSPRHNTRAHLFRAGAALSAFAVFGLAPLVGAPTTQADPFDLDFLSDIGAPAVDSAGVIDPGDAAAHVAELAASFDSSVGSELPALAAVPPHITDTLEHAAPSAAAIHSAPALAATPNGNAVPDNTAPLKITAVTEPIATIHFGDSTKDVPVVLDTGSNGLVVGIGDIGLKNLTWPTHFGFGAYSGGMGYLYGTMNETVSFGNGITTTDTVPVNVILFAWPTKLDTFFSGWSLHSFLGPAQANGVLGIAPDAVGPNAVGTPTVIQALPAGLNNGVLIDELNKQLVFGANPLTGGTTVNGVANANLMVGIGNNTPTLVKGAIIDSGGVFGTVPTGVPGAGSVGSTIPPGTEISVYNQDGQHLYSYTVSHTDVGYNGPTVIPNGYPMNTGYAPFAQMPVYIGYGAGGPTTTFGGTAGAGS